jgi:cbb3-type cytochrome c oxidase subunit III
LAVSQSHAFVGSKSKTQIRGEAVGRFRPAEKGTRANVKRSLTTLLATAAMLAGLSSVYAGSVSAAGTAAPDGKAIFANRCSGCHSADGKGLGPYPPLAGNPDLSASDTSGLINTLLNGRSGPIQINGKTYSGAMPAWKGTLSNAEIAAVLSYVRTSWGNKGAVVSEDQIAAASAPMALSGAAIFATKCATCHQANGKGTSIYPPLAGNPHVTAGDPSGMIATIVNGRHEPIVVNGTTFNNQMPSWKGTLSNYDIAAVATYIRNAWGNKAPGVTEQQVAAAGTPVLAAVGGSIYEAKCKACHGANGQGGGGGAFPALAGNATVNASDPSAILGTIAHGRSMMPSWKGQLSPADIAAVATYIRSAWGNKGGPVTEQQVAATK